MAKDKTLFSCSDCNQASPKWLGKCPGCGAWNTMGEIGAPAAGTGRNRFASLAPLTSQPIAIGDVAARDVDRTPTGIEEFDRVLGGGVVEGCIAMVGGDPGIGNHTPIAGVGCAGTTAPPYPPYPLRHWRRVSVASRRSRRCIRRSLARLLGQWSNLLRGRVGDPVPGRLLSLVCLVVPSEA